MKKKNGFSLMEAIVTVVILGVLASVGIPSFQNMMKDTKIKDASTNLLILYTAEKIYFNENGNYFQGANVAALNTGLNLGIIPGDTFYACNATLCIGTGSNFGLSINITVPTPVVN